jgi:mannosyltransferase
LVSTGVLDRALADRTALLPDPESTHSLASRPAGARLLRPALILGLVGALVSFAGSWIPSFWGDEAATILAASRPLPTLFSMLTNVDAVHGTYYTFMHFWIAVFGSSELAVRVPSAIAAGFVVAGTVTLARRLWDRSTAIISGIIVTVMPQLTHMGMEGRSYAFAIAIAVWLTVLFLRTVESNPTRLRDWLAYAFALAAGMYVFLYLGLIVLAHGVVVARRRPNGGRRHWVSAVGIAVVIASPVIIAGLTQREQVAYLATRQYAAAGNVLVAQWFGSVPFAILAWVLIVVAVVNGVRARDSRVLFLGSWLVLPTAMILAVDALLFPSYSMRYLTFCLPAAAVLMARGVVVTRQRRFVVLGIAGVVALAVPTYLSDRMPYGKDGGSDLRQVAEFVHATASPGDAVVFSDETEPFRRPRLSIDVYPQDFVGLVDVALVTPFPQRSDLWDSTLPVESLGRALSTTSTVWAIEPSDAQDPADIAALRSFGFHIVTSFHSYRTTIYQLSR